MTGNGMRSAGRCLLFAAVAVGSLGCFNSANTTQAIRKSRTIEVEGDFRTIAVAITSYAVSEGNLPAAEDIDGMAALLEPKYVRVMARKDPWGEPYWFETDGDSWTLSSPGKDGKWDTADDIEMEDGQFTKMPPSKLG